MHLTATLSLALIIGAIIIFRQRKNLPALKYPLFLLVIDRVCSLRFSFCDSYQPVSGACFADGCTAKLRRHYLNFSFSHSHWVLGFMRNSFSGCSWCLLLFYSIRNFFNGKYTAYTVSAIIAAVAFSGVHYVGEFGDAWTLGSFLFRFLFGLTLNVIYVVRGFGCTAWTHALYDLIVVFKI